MNSEKSKTRWPSKRGQRIASHRAILSLRFTEEQTARILSDESLLGLLMPVLKSNGTDPVAFAALQKAVKPKTRVESFRSFNATGAIDA